MPCVTPLRLAVALAGSAEPSSTAHWTDLVQEAERGKLDFVTIEAPTGSTPGVVPGFDAALIAARLAPLTSRIGLVPTVSTAPPPAQISGAIATLDSASSGRAGWAARADQLDQAADVVQAVRQLGQPVVVAEAGSEDEYRFAARSADLVLISPTDEDDVRRVVAEVRAQESAADRTGAGLRIFADVTVFLADTEAAAKARSDDWPEAESPFKSTVFAGTPTQLMRRLQAWQRAGIEGFRLHPAVLADDLPAITRGLVPALQENDAFRRGYEARNLRALLGLPRAVSRPAPVG